MKTHRIVSISMALAALALVFDAVLPKYVSALPLGGSAFAQLAIIFVGCYSLNTLFTAFFGSDGGE